MKIYFSVEGKKFKKKYSLLFGLFFNEVGELEVSSGSKHFMDFWLAAGRKFCGYIEKYTESNVITLLLFRI